MQKHTKIQPSHYLESALTMIRRIFSMAPSVKNNSLSFSQVITACQLNLQEINYLVDNRRPLQEDHTSAQADYRLSL